MRKEIFQAANQHVAGRIAALTQQLLALDEAQAGESKSSAGDKFETSREMMQQQRDQLAAQLAVQREHALALEVAARQPIAPRIGLGSVVTLVDGRVFLIATALGKFSCDTLAVMAISAASPLAQALWGKRESERIQFRNQDFQVEQVF